MKLFVLGAAIAAGAYFLTKSKPGFAVTAGKEYRYTTRIVPALQDPDALIRLGNAIGQAGNTQIRIEPDRANYVVLHSASKRIEPGSVLTQFEGSNVIVEHIEPIQNATP